MITRSMHQTPTVTAGLLPLLAAALLWPAPAPAQVPVDDEGNPVEALDESAAAAAGDVAEEAPLLGQDELEALVGPIALYPDKLLAIVLPASTYPLEIVQAARFLEEVEEDSSLKPDESWDDSVTALLNYPEVVEMMNDDIDWTWRLGEAVIQQQADVIAAVESFRDRAYAAGNLKTDERQRVSNDSGVIEIEPLEEDIIYVPYYEPERVVHYQPRQVYYYYPRPYPVYYYPYPSHHSFFSGYFWGVTTAFRIGWATDHLHVFHHSYWGHPYYGRQYFGHWYRRPSITIYNNYYVNKNRYGSRDHHRDGDYWRPRDGGARPGHYWARNERFRDHPRTRTREGYRDDSRRATVTQPGFRGDASEVARSNDRANRTRGFAASRDSAATGERSRSNPGNLAGNRARAADRQADNDAPIRFRARERAAAPNVPRSAASATNAAVAERDANVTGRRAENPIRFRSRDRSADTDTRSRSEPGVTRRAPSTDSRFRSSPEQSAPAVQPRTHRAPATQAAPRSTAPTRAAPGRASPRTVAPRTATPRSSAPSSSAPRTSAPRSSAPRSSSPRSSAPRSSAPRTAAPRPRASAPTRAAPARESRAAPRRSSGTSPRLTRERN